MLERCPHVYRVKIMFGLQQEIRFHKNKHHEMLGTLVSTENPPWFEHYPAQP